MPQRTRCPQDNLETQQHNKLQELSIHLLLTLRAPNRHKTRICNKITPALACSCSIARHWGRPHLLCQTLHLSLLLQLLALALEA